MPDKRQIAASFSRAAKTYDSAALLQREVGHKLLALLPARPPEENAAGAKTHSAPIRWLDIGCGSGYFTRTLAALHAQSQGFALDIAQGMLQQAKSQGGAQHWIAADAENLPLADNSFDLLFSNLCLQWCENLGQVLKEAHRVLRTGGILAFSSLASGTLSELRQAWQQADSFTHVNRFRPLADYQSLCQHSALTVLQLNCTPKLRHYPQLRQLTGELKALGAHNLSTQRPRGLGGRTRLAAMTQAYQQQQTQQGLPATWQVVYAVLRKES